MKMNLVARTYAGLEEVLAEELNQLGAEHVKIAKRAVEYSGDKEILYKTLLLSKKNPLKNPKINKNNSNINNISSSNFNNISIYGNLDITY